MSESQSTPRETLREWNEDGRLYLWSGVVSVIVSWLLIPLFGLLAAYSGYKLYTTERRVLSSVLIAGLGGVAFLIWINYLTTL